MCIKWVSFKGYKKKRQWKNKHDGEYGATNVAHLTRLEGDGLINERLVDKISVF